MAIRECDYDDELEEIEQHTKDRFAIERGRTTFRAERIA